MVTKIPISLAICCLVPIIANAQSNPVTLGASTVLDGRGGVLHDVTIVVEDGRIAAMPSGGGSATYDLTGLTLLPGGIDTHVHLSWHFDPDGRIHDATPEEESPEQAALYAAENAYKMLMAGFTTVQSLGAPIDREVRDAVARGVLPGPRILTSLGALFEETGDPDELRRVVRERAEQGGDVIKIFASASIRVGGTPTMSQEQLDAACGEATALGLRTAVHAHGPESARRAVLAGCTVIEHGALLDDETLELMAENGTFYDPHIGLIFRNYFENKAKFLGVGNYTEDGFAQMERAVPTALRVFQHALETDGLMIVFGTDAVAGAHGRNFEELIYRVEEGGEDRMGAIVSLTSRAAKSLGLGDRIGTIAEGMAADVIGVDGNPLEDITALRRVMFVMKDGTVYKNVRSAP